MKSLPHTTGELIRALDDLFPEVVPMPGDTPDKIFHAAGQRSVVHFLQRWRDNAGREPPAALPRGRGRPVT